MYESALNSWFKTQFHYKDEFLDHLDSWKTTKPAFFFCTADSYKIPKKSHRFFCCKIFLNVIAPPADTFWNCIVNVCKIISIIARTKPSVFCKIVQRGKKREKKTRIQHGCKRQWTPPWMPCDSCRKTVCPEVDAGGERGQTGMLKSGLSWKPLYFPPLWLVLLAWASICYFCHDSTPKTWARSQDMHTH